MRGWIGAGARGGRVDFAVRSLEFDGALAPLEYKGGFGGARAASSSPPLPARNEWGEDRGENFPKADFAH